MATDRGGLGLRIGGTAERPERHVHYTRAGARRVLDRLDDRAAVYPASEASGSQRDDRGGRCNAGNSRAVVGRGSGYTGDVGAMAVAVFGPRVVGEEVPAADVVDVTVPVVVDAGRSRRLARVHPYLAR